MITTGLCRQFKLELWHAIHDMRTDVIKAALFDATANLGPDTLEYSAVGEASGAGYTPGGIIVPVKTGHPLLNTANQAECRFDPATWPTITVTYRGVLIYNSSKGNRAIAVINRGVDKSVVNGPLTLNFPTSLQSLLVIS